MKKLSICTALVLGALFAHGQISINEIFSSNANTVYDPEYMGSPDYIELFNSGENTADLTGYSLTDEESGSGKWTIPAGTEIVAKGTVLIWADGKDKNLHANFKLSQNGETITLYAPSGTVEDQVAYDSQYENVSFGRWPDGSDTWKYFAQPTPDAINYAPLYKAPASKPEFSTSSGFYSKAQTVSLSVPNGTTVYYTTDGSVPTVKSTEYTAPLSITETTVVKAVCVKNDIASAVSVATFFIGERSFDLPIISLSTDPDNFFGNTNGIYVKGTNGETGRCSDDPVNWNRDWERPIFVEYFSPSGVPLIQNQASTRIMGGCSRTMAQKSLTIVAENGRFEYPFFEDREAQSYKSIVLRNSGNDWGGGSEEWGYDPGTLMRDAFMQNLVKDRMDIDMQEYQPVAVFLNGEYWGMQNMREHLNENYLKNIHPDIDENDLDLIKNYWDVKEGDAEALDALATFLENNSLSDSANYAYVASQVDIDEYMNYQLSEIYFSNTDWPGNNIRMWRERKASGKWRFIMFDTDFGFGIWGHSPYENDLESASTPFGEGWPNPPHSTLLFRKLLENDGFKNEFIQRFAAHIETTFDPSRVESLLSSMKNAISHEMPYQLERWYDNANTIEEWEDRISEMGNWGEQRQPAMRNMLKEFFNLQDPIDLYIANENPAILDVAIAGAWLGAKNGDVTCFPNIPTSLSVKIADGYSFIHWEDSEGTVLSTEPDFVFTPEQTVSITPIVAKMSPISGIFINEMLASNKGLVAADNGKSPDYVEIYNSTDAVVNLSGLYLSDDATNLLKYRLPYSGELTIAPKGFLRLWADSRPDLGPLHVDWKLDKDNGHIILLQRIDGANTVLDEVEYSTQEKNYSFGRYPDGSESLSVMKPTPNNQNSLLSSMASLHSLKSKNLPLQPTFSPDIFAYSIIIPTGFPMDVPIEAIPYGQATVSSSAAENVQSYTVTSEDKSTTSVYSVTLQAYEDISNMLTSVTFEDGLFVKSFSPEATEYTIVAELGEVPEFEFIAEDTNAIVTIDTAKSMDDIMTISLESPNWGTRIYSFAFVDEMPPLTGHTENFNELPSYWGAPDTTFTTLIENGIAEIGVDKKDPWHAIGMNFNGKILDLTDNPYLQIGITASEDAVLRIDFIDDNGISTNGVAITQQLYEDDKQLITYDFTDGFYQTWPELAICDQKAISSIWMCFNPGENNYDAHVSIDFIRIGDEVIIASEEKPVTPSVVLSDGTMYPKFDASKPFGSYIITDFSTTPLIFATTDDPTADVVTTQFPSNQNDEVATVQISRNGTEIGGYSFTLLNHDISEAPLLAGLTVQEGTLDKPFDPNTFEYTVTPDAFEVGNISVTRADEYSSLRIFQARSLFQKSYVILESFDGTKTVYTINYIVPDNYPGLLEPGSITSEPTSSCTDCPVNAQQNSADYAIAIYPNPATEAFSLNAPAKTITIYSTQGAVLQKISMVESGMIIDITSLPKGELLISVEGYSETLNTILIKE